MSSILRFLAPAGAIVAAVGLALIPGCDLEDPACSCSVDRIEFPPARADEDTVTASFTVRNSGDGDRLAYAIVGDPTVGLDVLENPVYVLDEGESIDYTLAFAPFDSVSLDTLQLRVGPGNDCLIDVIFGARAPRVFGACCFPSGVCEQDTLVSTEGDTTFVPIDRERCAELGGNFLGAGTECGSPACPLPEPACDIGDTTVSFGFELADLGTSKLDTFVIRNVGEGVLRSARPFPLCQSGAGAGLTFTALTNAGTDGDLFAIPAGDSAVVQIESIYSGNFVCDFTFNSNTPAGSGCPSLRIEVNLNFEPTPREIRR